MINLFQDKKISTVGKGSFFITKQTIENAVRHATLPFLAGVCIAHLAILPA